MTKDNTGILQKWICQPCKEGRHGYCQMNCAFANCHCSSCMEINYQLTKKTLQDKYEVITGVRPN